MSQSDIGKRGNYGALFRNGTMDFAASWLLGYAQQGGMSPGALLRCFAQIRNGRPASWAATFERAGRAAHARAVAAQSSARHTIAAQEWLAAAVAHRAALMMCDPTTSEAQALTNAMQEAFRAHLRTANLPIASWSIPFQDGHLPAYVSTGVETAEVLFVVLGGGDTYVEDLWFFGGKHANDEGWPILMVDLPGQGSTPDQGFHFGPQTRDGLRATLDAVRGRGFAGDLVLCGWSGGGIFVTKFVSIATPEDRVRAWIASTPVHDAQRFFTQALPALLRRDPSSALARTALRLARGNPVMRGALRKYDWQFGPGGIANALTTIADLGRTDLRELDSPVLALIGSSEDPEGLRQATEVVNAVRLRHPESELHTFDPDTGADSHCQIANLPLALATAFDWLQRIGIQPDTPPNHS